MKRNNKEDGKDLSIEELAQLPVGCAYHDGWGCDDFRGYVELHPNPKAKIPSTVQIFVDQKLRTIHINGFPKTVKQDAINAWTFTFE